MSEYSCRPDQKPAFSPRTLLEYLRDPHISVKRPTAEIAVAPKTASSSSSSSSSSHGECLPLAQDHKAHVRRWTDFSYTVLRIALKDILTQPLDVTPASTNREAEWVLGLGEFERNSPQWLGSIRSVPQEVNVDVWSPLELGKRLNVGVMQGVDGLKIEEKPLLRARIRSGKLTTEEMRKFGCPQDADWSLRIRRTEQQGGNGEQEGVKWAVLGMNKTTHDFPISSLGKFDADGRVDTRIERTLRQLGTICWEKETPYGFVLTAEGAAILLFKEIHADGESESGASSPKGGQQPELGVWWTKVPWTKPPDDVRESSLLMALWSLCLIAVCDDDRAFDGATARLNGWHQRKEARRIWYDHRVVPQPSRGLPPRAESLSRSRLLSTSVAPSMNQGSPASFFGMYRGWMPDGCDISTEGLSFPTITRFMQQGMRRVYRTFPLGQDGLATRPDQTLLGSQVTSVSGQQRQTYTGWKPAPSLNATVKDESVETAGSDFQPANDKDVGDRDVKDGVRPGNTITASPRSRPTHTRSKRKRRRANQQVSDESPEPWSQRLRPRRRRPAYRV